MSRVPAEIFRNALQAFRELHADVELFPSGDVKSLNFVGTSLTDEDLTMVALFAHLQRLYLGATSVTDAGMNHLEGLKSLEYLSLHGTEVSARCMVQLRVLLPNCMICPRNDSAGISVSVSAQPASEQVALNEPIASSVQPILAATATTGGGPLQREILQRVQSLEQEIVALRKLIEQAELN